MAKKNEMVVSTKSGELKIVVMDITPTKAKNLLRMNTNNRNLRENRVDQYACDMKTGHWYANGMPIVIRSAIKPTPSISKLQQSINAKLENIDLEIKGRHDPCIVRRARVVIDSLVAFSILDSMLSR